MTVRRPGVSAESAARVLAVYGERGAAWLAQLGSTIDACAVQWELAEGGAPFAGARASFVAPARRRDGAPLVLKIAPAPEWATHEARALAHWAGEGAVRLEAADEGRGAILVERAVPGSSLARGHADLSDAADDRGATSAAADVIARLRLATAPVPNGSLPDITTWTARLRGAESANEAAALAVPRREARAVATALLAASGPPVVLHGDLHHENVLASERMPWLAADPKGVVGPAEAEASALLRNPRRVVLHHADRTKLLRDRVAILSDRLGDAPAMLAWWGFTLAVVAACRAAEDGEGDEVARWLACAEPLRRVAREHGAV